MDAVANQFMYKLGVRYRIKGLAEIDVGYDNRFAIGQGERPVVHRFEQIGHS